MWEEIALLQIPLPSMVPFFCAVKRGGVIFENIESDALNRCRRRLSSPYPRGVFRLV